MFWACIIGCCPGQSTCFGSVGIEVNFIFNNLSPVNGGCNVNGQTDQQEDSTNLPHYVKFPSALYGYTPVFGKRKSHSNIPSWRIFLTYWKYLATEKCVILVQIGGHSICAHQSCRVVVFLWNFCKFTCLLQVLLVSIVSNTSLTRW